jgi:hypothetical protein
MSTTFKSTAESYLRAKGLSRGTRNEYLSTIRKWERWGSGSPIEQLRRKDVREFLDWVHEEAVKDGGTNAGRTANKAEHLRAVISWAWEKELIEAPPRFPGPTDQRDVVGRHYLSRAEISALFFATHSMVSPRGWDPPCRSAGTGAALWPSSSTTAWTPGRHGSLCQPMSQSSGGTSREIDNPPTERSKSNRSGAGCSIGG